MLSAIENSLPVSPEWPQSDIFLRLSALGVAVVAPAPLGGADKAKATQRWMDAVNRLGRHGAWSYILVTAPGHLGQMLDNVAGLESGAQTLCSRTICDLQPALESPRAKFDETGASVSKGGKNG